MERRLSISSWGLALLAAFLGIYVYLVEVRGGERQERAQEASAHLLPFAPEAATELVLERPDGRIVCRKTPPGGWRITTPVRTDADEMTVTHLLSDVAEARIERTLTVQPQELAPFGLAHPLRLTVAHGAQRVEIDVGKGNPTDNFVYALRELSAAGRTQGGGRSEATQGAAKGEQKVRPYGSAIAGPTHAVVGPSAKRQAPSAAAKPLQVLLVERRLQDAAGKTLYDLREKTILEFSPEDVKAITFTTGNRRVRLVRDKGVSWKLMEPLRARADRGMVERTFNLVSYVRAEQFMSETPTHLEQYGLAPPWGSARFDLKGGRSEIVLLGRKTEAGATTRYFARRPGPGPVFTINDNLSRDAQRAPEEWRERHVTDFTRADVTELRLVSPARTVVCVRNEGPNGDDWRLAEFSGRVAEAMNLGAAARLPTAQRADRDRVEDLLAHLGTLEAKSFLDGAAASDPRFGLAHPELKIVAIDKTGQRIASVSLGSLHGSQRYATGPHLDGVFLVLDSETQRFHVGAGDLAAR
jgi:Domain of unknown function (DUF4340)